MNHCLRVITLCFAPRGCVSSHAPICSTMWQVNWPQGEVADLDKGSNKARGLTSSLKPLNITHSIVNMVDSVSLHCKNLASNYCVYFFSEMRHKMERHVKLPAAWECKRYRWGWKGWGWRSRYWLRSSPPSPPSVAPSLLKTRSLSLALSLVLCPLPSRNPTLFSSHPLGWALIPFCFHVFALSLRL